MVDNIKKQLLEGRSLKQRLLQDPEVLETINDSISVIRNCLQSGNKLLIAGNGGSAADAQHFAAEIVGRYKKERKGYPAIALTSDTSMITQWSNDYSFNTLFSRQIESLGKKDDLFIGISTSGNSKNLIEAAKTARKQGLKVIAFLGKDGGILKRYSDLTIIIPSDNTPRIQESHIALIHIICEELENVYGINNRVKLSKIISNFSKQKIIVIGDILLDKYLHSSVERISPEAPVLIANVLEESFSLGGAGNTAFNLSELGTKVILIGRIGKDKEASIIKKLLSSKKIDISLLITDKKLPTIIKTRVLSGVHQLIRIDQEKITPLGQTEVQGLIDQIEKRVKDVKVLIVSDYGKGFITEEFARSLIKMCQKEKVMMLVDSKIDHFSKYKDVFLIKPNKKEAQLILGQEINVEDPNLFSLAKKVKRKLNCLNLVITLGGEGLLIVFSNNKVLRVKTNPREVFDLTGAGDTTIAAIGATLSGGGSLEEAAIIGNLAGGVVVSKKGTAVCSKQELIDQLDYL